MEKLEYENMYNAEDTHFYYVSLHKTILSFLKKHSSSNKLQILDAGCGTGRLAELMKPFGNITAIDLNDEALKFAKKRRINVKKASVTKIPFQSNNFDVVTSIDVIVSKEVDDEKALSEFYRVLKPNGILILRVSAIPWLKLSHDKFVYSNKRYTKNTLKQKLEKVGFKIEKISYMNASLAPVGIAQHFYERLFPPSQNQSSITKINTLINKTATGILSFEEKLLHQTNLPFGLGLLAICRK